MYHIRGATDPVRRAFGRIGSGLPHGYRGVMVQLSQMSVSDNGRIGRKRASGGLPHGGADRSESAPDGRVTGQDSPRAPLGHRLPPFPENRGIRLEK
jgi:hypothetical protein